MNVNDTAENLNSFLEEYMEKIGEEAKEIRRDLELIRELDEVRLITIWLLRNMRL